GSWKPPPASTFLVAIQVEALDRHKLLADITKVLSDEKVNILSATVTTTRDRVALSRFSVEMADPEPVQLRDARPEGLGSPAGGGTPRGGRLRRLPGDLRRLRPPLAFPRA